MTWILDSSAILAVIREEAGAERVASAIPEARVSAANVVEIIAKLIDLGHTPDTASEIVASLSVETLSFSEADGELAGRLREKTRRLGLSLGDRACLATAIRRNATVLTADRAWADLDVGCRIELIR